MTGGFEVARIEAVIEANASRFDRTLQQSERNMQRFVRGANREASGLSRSLGREFAGMAKVGATALGAVGVAAGAAGIASVKLAARLEQSRVAFGTLLGSGKRAEAFLKDLQKFAASTPFEFDGLQQSARLMLAMGFNARKVLPNLRVIGDAVGALGGGAPEIDRVVRALGQMQAKQKVSAEEMVQLSELGIGAWQMLANEIGVSVPEAMKRAERGMIDGATGVNAILRGMDAKFAGAMEAQSQTTAGKWSNFMDTLKMRAAETGEKIIKAFDINGRLDQAMTVLSSKGFADGLEQAINGAARAFNGLAAGIQFVSDHWQALTAGAAGAGAAFIAFSIAAGAVVGPVGLIVGAVAAAGAGLVMLYKKSETARAVMQALWQVLKASPLGVAARAIDALAQKVGGWGDLFRHAGIVMLEFTRGALVMARAVVAAVNDMAAQWTGRFAKIAQAVAIIRPEFKSAANAISAMANEGKSSTSKMERAMTRDIAAIDRQIGQLRSQINSLPTIKSVTIDVRQRTSGGGTSLPTGPKFADGGIVSGPGTGRSDSIIARVSNGEAIIPERSTSANRKVVDWLIDHPGRRLPGFAKGKKAAAKKVPPKQAAANRAASLGASASLTTATNDAARAKAEATPGVADDINKWKVIRNAADAQAKKWAAFIASKQYRLLDAGGKASAQSSLASARRDATRAREELARLQAPAEASPGVDAPAGDAGSVDGGSSTSVSDPAADARAQAELEETRALLAQAQQRAATEAERARLSEAALGVFSGAGDIGFGGANAYDAARRSPMGAPTVVVNSLTGYDPAIQRAVATVADGGFSQGGSASKFYSGRAAVA